MTITTRDNNLKTLTADKNKTIEVEDYLFSTNIALSKSLSLLTDDELKEKFKEITIEEAQEKLKTHEEELAKQQEEQEKEQNEANTTQEEEGIENYTSEVEEG